MNSDISQVPKPSCLDVYGSFFVRVITGLSVLISMVPVVIAYNNRHSLIVLSETYQRSIEIALLVTFGITCSKTFEVIGQRAQVVSLQKSQLPYSHGFSIVAIAVTIQCLIIIPILEKNIAVIVIRSTLAATNLVVLFSALMILTEIFSKISIKYVLKFSVLLTFLISELLESLSYTQLNDFGDEHGISRQFFTGSVIALAISCGTFINFARFNITILIRNYETFEEVMNNESSNIVLISLTIIFLLSKLICNIAYDVIVDYELLLFTEIILSSIYASLVLYLPNQLLWSGLVRTTVELESKQAYVSWAAHEIRSPLSTVIQGIDILLAEIKEAEHAVNHQINNLEFKDLLENIKLSSEIATSTLNDMLAFDKIRSDRMQLELQMTNALAFIKYSLKPFYVQARASGITLKTNIGVKSDFVGIMIDKGKMDQVFRNFISNALKFSPRGSTVTIDIKTIDGFSSTPKQSDIVPPGFKGAFKVSVTDEGAGIAPENQHVLFGKYVQINANKLQNGKGSGLGLWLAKSFVEIHGGIIGMTSEGEGKGSTFYFEIPYAEINGLPGSNKIKLKESGSRYTANIKYFNSRHSSDKASRLDSDRDAMDYKPPDRASLFNSRRQSFNNNPDLRHIDNNEDPTGTLSGDNSIAPGDGLYNRRPSERRINIIPSPNRSEHSRYGARLSRFPSGLRIHPLSRRNSDLDQIIESADHVLINQGSVLADPVPRHTTSTTIIERESSDMSSEPKGRRESNVPIVNILIADDSPIGRKMVEKLLHKVSLVCDHASDGADALAKVQAAINFYHVILLDYHMPKMDGIEATRRIRAIGYNGIILGVTGATDSEVITEFIHSGADNVLIKPLSLDGFIATIQEINSKRHVTPEIPSDK